MHPILLVRNGGAQSSIQDLGRWGYQHEGVPPGGALDIYSAALANRLLGNRIDEAVIEITLMGFEVEALERVAVALTGADLDARLNGAMIRPWRVIVLEPGDTLAFRGPRNGCRAYLAVHGGLDVPLVLGSRSTDLIAGFGGVGGRALRQGDVLGVRCAHPSIDLSSLQKRAVRAEYVPTYNKCHTVRMVLGPQLTSFTHEAVAFFLSSEYQVTSASSRMALRLEGRPVAPMTSELDSEGTPPGSIQVPGNGQPIVLLRGCQTTGGYHKIGTVINPDLDLLAQARPGFTRLRFQAVTLAEAHGEYERWRRAMEASEAISERKDE